MGLFDSMKQAAQAAQQMADGNVKVSVSVGNKTVKIGETLQGTITVTSVLPCLVNNFQVHLTRERDDTGADPESRQQWFFNRELIEVNVQLQPNQPQSFPFGFTVQDGLGAGLNNVDPTTRSEVVIGGVDPIVLPDMQYSYKHSLTVWTKLDNTDFGPFDTVDVEFTYPVFNSGLNFTPDQ